MNKRRELTGEALDRLLAWLDPDREQAGRKYEHIRQSLIRIFIWRGCGEAEDVADETINRVALKVPQIAATYSGDPALYFYGVGRKVLLEYQKRQQLRLPPEAMPVETMPLNEGDAAAELERRHVCMEQCLQKLSGGDRDLIKVYYQSDSPPGVDPRKELANRLGISSGALRVRIHRLRAVLLKCIRDCLDGGA